MNTQSPSRRQMLRSFAGGFGTLALAALLADESRASSAAAADANPLALRPPMYPARAKRVIFLFMSGGPSTLDLFDHKPRLQAEAGKPLPFDLPKLIRTRTGVLLPSPFKFDRHGQSGIEMSELLPNLATHADDLCIIKSMVADNINHNGACLQMNTGEQAFSRPSMGSWLLYGLGTENQNLPGYVVLAPNQPAQGAPLWGNSFLPAAYQGTLVTDMKNPIANLVNAKLQAEQQRKQLDALNELNQLHAAQREEDSRLSARIASFELAFRMQTEAPAAFDVTNESEATKKLYGLDNPTTELFGRQLLMARRLSERGVRMVQVYHTATANRTSCQLWDQHGNLRADMRNNCAASDGPIAGLLTDLKSRGLLDDTLVVWGGEFGRTPTAENADGREHHPFGFSMWLAGGGARPGTAYGSTDDYGFHATPDTKVHVHDLHATILHLMGIDHEKLTYRYSGRDYRLTDVYGTIVKPVLA